MDQRNTPSGDALERAVAAAVEFNKHDSYLEHPAVREFRGTANGDSVEAWKRDLMTELCRKIISAFMQSETVAPSFDMMAELKKRLADEGWTVKEAAPSDDKKDDATPRTDAAEYAGRVMASFARQLERELAIAKKRLWIELEAPTTIGTQSAGVARIECSNCGAKYERYEAPCPHCSFSAVPSATTPIIRAMRPCARHEGIPFVFTAYVGTVATYCPHCEAESAA